MTLKELIMKTSFDDILPYLERHETAHRDNLYAFREAYDILKNMKPNRDYHEKATIECHVRPDESKYVRVLFWTTTCGRMSWPNSSFSPTIPRLYRKNWPCTAFGKSLFTAFHPLTVTRISVKCLTRNNRPTATNTR